MAFTARRCLPAGTVPFHDPERSVLPDERTPSTVIDAPVIGRASVPEATVTLMFCCALPTVAIARSAAMPNLITAIERNEP